MAAMERDTRQRDAIKSVLRAAKRPLLAGEVLEAGRSVVHALGIATVYRNLDLLDETAVTSALAMKKANTLNCVNTIPQQDSAGLALMPHRYIVLLFWTSPRPVFSIANSSLRFSRSR